MLVVLAEAVGGYPAGQIIDAPDVAAARDLVSSGRARWPTLDEAGPEPVDIPADDEPLGVTVADVRAYAAAHHITTHEAKRQLAAAARQAAPTQ